MADLESVETLGMQPLQGTAGNKRTRLRHACTPCHRAHTSCDPDRPCTRCEKLNIADQCVDAESKKRGRKPGSTKAALDAAKKAKSEILAHLSSIVHHGGSGLAADPSSALLGTDGASARLHQALTELEVLDNPFSHVPLGDEVFASLAHIKTLEPVSFSSPYARGLNSHHPMGRDDLLGGLGSHHPLQPPPALPLPTSSDKALEDVIRTGVIFSSEIHVDKELGLIIKLAVQNMAKTPFQALRLSLFFVRSETKDVDRPTTVHLLNQEGRISKDLTASYTDMVADPFTLNPGDLKLLTLAIRFPTLVRRDAHFVLNCKATSGASREVIKEERIPIMLLSQCDGYRTNSRVPQGSKGFPVGPHHIRGDSLRKLFNLEGNEGISPGDQFVLESSDEGAFLAFAEVRRIEDIPPLQSVELDLYQGPGEGASEAIAELRTL